MSGMEKSNVNQCEIRCPAIAMGDLQYRVETKGVAVPGRIIPYLRGAELGLELAYRANLKCETRHENEEEWQPSEVCVARAREAATKLGPLAAETLIDHERKVFGFAGIEIDREQTDTP